MSRAVLILDEMPSKCEDCPFVATLRLSNTPISMCYVIKRPEVSADLEEGRPHWCLLKEMPKRKGLFAEMHQYDTDIHYEIGWNACLEEIER